METITEQDLDGNRKRVERSCTTTARFTLNQGRYYVWAETGNATAAAEFDIEPGGLVNEIMDLAAGQLRLQAALKEGGDPVNTCFNIYHAEQDLDDYTFDDAHYVDMSMRTYNNGGGLTITATIDVVYDTTFDTQ